MAEEMKKVTVNNEEVKEQEVKEEKKNLTPNGMEVTGQDHPVRDFFRNNKKKFLGAAALAGAVGVGVLADRFGGKLPMFKKKTQDDQAATEE